MTDLKEESGYAQDTNSNNELKHTPAIGQVHNDELDKELNEGEGFDGIRSDSKLNKINAMEKVEGDENPDEIPEKHESENERLEYPAEKEFTQQDYGNDASYSEQTDVTPPRTREFPSVGNVKTDFASRPHGRTTGRMVGHEPGTEGI